MGGRSPPIIVSKDIKKFCLQSTKLRDPQLVNIKGAPLGERLKNYKQTKNISMGIGQKPGSEFNKIRVKGFIYPGLFFNFVL